MTPEIAHHLWDLLWKDYSNRVPYARIYAQTIQKAGGTVANDHIAFRSLRMSVDSPQRRVNLGIDYLEQLVQLLGYEAAGEYSFPETHLYARHYRHPQQEEFDLPKLFVSELIVDELPEEIVQLIYQTVSGVNLLIPSAILNTFNTNTARLVKELSRVFSTPWQPPKRSVVEHVNEVTQYGAWVLIHGYAVNHFTGYVNRQNTSTYPDIETTARALADSGVPMKEQIEGDVSCGLRQTATQAVTEIVSVLDDSTDTEIQIPWTYAYYELAQRYTVEVEPGKRELFDAFLGKNARQLFEMTRLVNG